MTSQLTWHVLEGQSSVGPLTELAVLKGYFEGRYGPDTMVWRVDGDATWKRLGDALPLAELTPPPLPGAASNAAPFAPATADAAAAISSNWVREPSYAWRRFFAKQVDVLLAATLMFALLGSVLSASDGAYNALIALENPIVLNVIGVFLAIVPNAILAGLSGRSLGKAIFGLKVVGEDGQPPGLAKGFRREMQLTAQGFGLGIPLISLFTMINSYSRLKSDGAAPWDADAELKVLYRKPTPAHFALMVLGIVLWVAIIAFLNAASANA